MWFFVQSVDLYEILEEGGNVLCCTVYLVAGDLSKEPNLQDLIEARASVGGNYLAAVIADEGDISKDIKDGAERLSAALKENISEPQNFFGVGGSKIFRDLIYEMRG